MNINLLSLAQQALGDDFSKLAGSFLGESPGATQSALTALLPAVLGSIAQKGATPQGASGLMSLINGAPLDTRSLGDLAGLLGGGGQGMSALLAAGSGSLVPALLGDKGGALASMLSSMSGIKDSSATRLLGMVVPLALTFLKKFIGDKGLDANALSALLASQGPQLQGALDSRMSGALGFASPAAFLGGLGSQAPEAARRAGTAVAGGATAATSAATAATKSSMARWLPWVIGAGVLVLLWGLLTNRWTSQPASTPVLSAPATAPAPAAVAPALLGKIYFDLGAATVSPDERTKIDTLAALLQQDNTRVTITGYTDPTGDKAQNEALAKARALAVRDALKAAGMAETRIEMKPPVFVELGGPEGAAEARRVEVSRQ